MSSESPSPSSIWQAIKRGALFGAISGIELSFVILMFLHPHLAAKTLVDTVLAWSGSGALVTAALTWIFEVFRVSLLWVEQDLKHARRMLKQGLIEEADYQAVKARLLESYRPDARVSGRRIGAAAGWGGLTGLTIAMAMMAGSYPAFLTADQFLSVLLLVTVLSALIGASIGYAYGAIRARRGSQIAPPAPGTPSTYTLEDHARTYRPLGTDLSDAGIPVAAKRK